MILDCTNQHCCTNWTDSRKSLYWTRYVAMCWRNTVRLGSRVSVLISNTTRYWSSLCLITYNLRWGWAVCRQPSHLWNPRCHHTLSPTVPGRTPPLDPPNCSYLLPTECQCCYKLELQIYIAMKYSVNGLKVIEYSHDCETLTHVHTLNFLVLVVEMFVPKNEIVKNNRYATDKELKTMQQCCVFCDSAFHCNIMSCYFKQGWVKTPIFWNIVYYIRFLSPQSFSGQISSNKINLLAHFILEILYNLQQITTAMNELLKLYMLTTFSALCLASFIVLGFCIRY